MAWIDQQTGLVLISRITNGWQSCCIHQLGLDRWIRILTIKGGAGAVSRIEVARNSITYCLPGHILDQQPG